MVSVKGFIVGLLIERSIENYYGSLGKSMARDLSTENRYRSLGDRMIIDPSTESTTINPLLSVTL